MTDWHHVSKICHPIIVVRLKRLNWSHITLAMLCIWYFDEDTIIKWNSNLSLHFQNINFYRVCHRFRLAKQVAYFRVNFDHF